MKGAPFRMLELHMVLIAELRTRSTNITVSSYVALSGVPGVPMQAPHFDDWSVKTLVASVSLNIPTDGAFRATLVPKHGIQFPTLWKASDAADGMLTDSIQHAFNELLDDLPDVLYNSMESPSRTQTNKKGFC